MAVAEGHEGGAGIGHGRQARLGHQAHVLPVEEGQQGLNLGRGGVLVQLVELQSLDMALEAGAGQVAAGRADFLDHEAVQRGQEFQDRSRNHLGRVVVPEGRGDEI